MFKREDTNTIKPESLDIKNNIDDKHHSVIARAALVATLGFSLVGGQTASIELPSSGEHETRNDPYFIDLLTSRGYSQAEAKALARIQTSLRPIIQNPYVTIADGSVDRIELFADAFGDTLISQYNSFVVFPLPDNTSILVEESYPIHSIAILRFSLMGPDGPYELSIKSSLESHEARAVAELFSSGDAEFSLAFGMDHKNNYYVTLMSTRLGSSPSFHMLVDPALLNPEVTPIPVLPDWVEGRV
ncbi:MAG: hypothetical protein RLY61_919 [Candidatus Parcubacteria bacterium]|jgi:hypothetical protein